MIIGLYFGLLIAIFASCLHLYPVANRLWCFSYPVFALMTFNTLEGIVHKKQVYEGVVGLAILIVVIGNTGYKKYSDATGVYRNDEELGLELDYLNNHMKSNDMVYVYGSSRPAFEYLNGYDNNSFGEGINNVVFGKKNKDWNSEYDRQKEMEKIFSYSDIWIVSSHENNYKRFQELVQDMHENGYLELVSYQYKTPLWYYCKSLDDVKKHFAMSVKNNVSDGDWNEATIHIKNDGEAYLNNQYDRIYLIEEKSGKIYPIDELIEPGKEIDVKVRYPVVEEPEYTLCGQYGKIAKEDTIKITKEMMGE